MGSLFPLTLLIFLSFASSSSVRNIEAQGIQSARLLDLVIRDYTFQSYGNYFKTGILHQIHLPSNLSGIKVDTIRFRCGSLRRYGAKIKEFHLGIGITIQHCVERVLIVRQNLGKNWSSIYYDNFELSGYKLVSPVLGLLAYNAGDDSNYSTNPYQLGIKSGEKPITIDFSIVKQMNSTMGLIPLCASFEHDGKVTLSNVVSPNICVATGHGHFGLVVESPLVPVRRREKKWKVAVGSSIGAAIGGALLVLLLIALFVKVKKKARMEELERRAYEEEALQVSMVGHVRAPTASGTRTVPTIEHQYRPPPT